MTTTPRSEAELDDLVAKLTRPTERKIRDALALEIAQHFEHQAGRNSLHSGYTLLGEEEIRTRTCEKLLGAHVEAERQVHRRAGLPLSSERKQSILARLRAAVAAQSSELHTGVTSSIAGNSAEGRRSAMRGKLDTFAQELVDELEADLSLPELAAPPSSITVNVNAPNHGVVAGRIDSLNVRNDGGRELQAALREILYAIEQLGEHAAEARELLFELTQQADAKPQRGLVRTGVSRLAQILSLAGAAERVLELVRQLPDLIDRGAGVILS